MPSWKKVIVSGSSATLNSLNVDTTTILGSSGSHTHVVTGSFDITGSGIVFPRVSDDQMTAISGPVKGQVVYNTTNETLYRYNGTSWGKESTFSSGSFLHTQDTAASKWEVTHSLGVQYLNVEVIDSDSKLLIVEDISFNDSSSLEINFQTPRTGYVSVTSGGGQIGADGVSVIKGAVSHSQASASDAWVIDHNLNWQYPNITVYDNNNQVLIPQTITSADANRLTIDFDSPVQGYAGISSGGGTQGPSGSAVLQGAFTHSQATAATHWPVTHSLGAQWVNVEIIDGNNKSTIPQTITFDTPNKLSVDFSSPLSGYAAVTSGGGQTGPTGSRGAAGLGWYDGTTYISSSVAIQVDGNVSGSAVSTGSFGKLVGEGGDITGITTFGGSAGTETSFSGSSASTGSFGHVIVGGNIVPTTDNSHNLGSSALRWANVYTADFHLSNINGAPNAVDGTAGSWTIQEGEDKLYLLNNKTKKKYSFVLKEEE